jgi:hypothetical protein
MDRRIKRKIRIVYPGFTALLMILCAAIMSALPADIQTEVSAEEYQVYNAVLGLVQLSKDDAHVVINDKTLNLQCGEKSENPVLLNGCSPMRVSNESLEEITNFLGENWPDLNKSTAQDFGKKNQASTRIREHISTPWKHLLVGDDIKDSDSKEWASPDMAIFASRVGFNPQNTEAIVYLLDFSYLENVPTEGDYFLFRRVGKGWQPKGRITYFQKDQSKSE